MKKTLLTIASILCFAAIGTAQTVHKDYMDGVIWVKVKSEHVFKKSINLNGPSKNNVLQLNDLAFGETLKSHQVTSLARPFGHIADPNLKYLIRIEFNDIQSVDNIIASLSNNAMVDYAEKAPLMKTTLTPNDPSFNGSNQWGLFQIDATSAWNVGTGDANVVVAIVDDAVEITHPDLSPVIWTNTGEIAGNGVDDDGNGYIDDAQGYDVADQDGNPNPDTPVSAYDHGTHVAGIAGAATDNNAGIASIGFGVSLMAVKSTNSASAVTHGYEGVVYAVENGADVVNMSWGGPGSSTTYQNIMNWAYGQGAVLIAAAGNDNVSSQFYPAAYNNVISVASTTTGDAKSGFSNYGSWIDISAPGSAIYSTVPNSGYQIKQGTSMASPMVAGLAGLLKSLNPGLSPADIESCILSTADNIDAANPSYVGDLGAGRINAFEAMNCVSATLNWAPEAAFQATSSVNIIEGQTVTFQDLSIYNPTTWSWSFTGGTPSTFNGQNPGPITYNTAGTYAVSLTVTNANGSDTHTETAYITVNALTGCDTISNTIPSDPNYTWTWGAPNGYIGGHNYIHPRYICDKYTGYGPTNLMGAQFYFTEGETNNPNAFITITVWEDAAGNPGSIVYQEDLLIDVIEANVTGAGAGSFYITDVDFDMPVSVSTNDFYVGYEVFYSAGDTVNCAMTDDLTSDGTRPNTMMYYIDPSDDPLGTGGGWFQTGGDIGAAEWSMHIYPRITQTPPTAVIQANPDPACVGDIVNFDGTSSPNAVNWEWAINGTANPYPTGGTPGVVMNSAGNHWVYMAAYNGCGFYHIDSTQVLVDPTPNVSVVATTDTICPAGSANLTATGAGSYVWTPAASLSCSNCPNPTATPTSTTTYNVVGTQGNCSSQSNYTIVVDDTQPTADYLVSSDTICEGESISFNGAISQDASSFSWTFTGGDISASTSATPTVVYATAGTYNVTLDVSNTCSQSDNTSGTVVVEVCGVGVGESALSNVNAIYDAANSSIVLDMSGHYGDLNIEITNVAGQRVFFNNYSSNTTIDISNLSKGLYLMNIYNDSARKTIKIMK